jgi:hypothetical protein
MKNWVFGKLVGPKAPRGTLTALELFPLSKEAKGCMFLEKISKI